MTVPANRTEVAVLLAESDDGNKEPERCRPSRGFVPGPSKKPAGGPGSSRLGLIYLGLAIMLVAYLLYSAGTTLTAGTQPVKLASSEFVTAVKDGRVSEVTYTVTDGSVKGSYWKSDKDEGDKDKLIPFTSTYVGSDSLAELMARFPKTKYVVDTDDPNFLVDVLVNVIPTVALIAVMVYFLRQMMGANSKAMQFGKTNAKTNAATRPKVKFADVAGIDEAVEELEEVRDFLAEPERFRKLGAKIPRGVLLVGPPGTGKTLLAKAVAGEAGVPFFSISGSDFVEMFVGVGASRVRDLFKDAKEQAPSIIFIDEIDAVGRQRGAGVGGGHDEREQTLNQLLVEMDGFEKNDAVVLIAATNRVDVLDPALLRPGRFDRQIVVDAPDVRGREKILEVHAKNKPIGPDVDLPRIAKLTSGMTGADLMNLMNEAALLTARRNKPQIGMAEVNESMERLMAGPERKNRVMNEKTRRIIAYHEAGHALVGHLLPNADPVHKITIVPRGMALGYTMSIPDEDKFLVSRNEMYDDLAVFLGGRVAEEIFCGDITTGASNDLERATKQARKMVTSYGMSDALGQQTFGQPNHEVFLGRDMGNTQDYSPETAQRIDEEVARLMKQAHDLAYAILSERQEQMHLMAHVLLERETVDGEACEALLNNTWDVYLEKEKEAEANDVKKKAKALLTAPSTMAASSDMVISGELPKDPAAPDMSRDVVSFTDPAAEAIPRPPAFQGDESEASERKDRN